jgi:hypothetical protein
MQQLSQNHSETKAYWDHVYDERERERISRIRELQKKKVKKSSLAQFEYVDKAAIEK